MTDKELAKLAKETYLALQEDAKGDGLEMHPITRIHNALKQVDKYYISTVVPNEYERGYQNGLEAAKQEDDTDFSEMINKGVEDQIEKTHKMRDGQSKDNRGNKQDIGEKNGNTH